MDAKVIENALDFVSRAASDLWNVSLTSEQQLKYSTIALYESIELLLKARLMGEHWSLVVRDIDRYNAGAFQRGDFASVGYDEARKRLESVCGVHIEENTHYAFDQLRRLRNRYVHFTCDDPRPSVLGTQLRAWHHVLRLFETGFLKLNKSQQAMLEEARLAMMRSEEFLRARYSEVAGEVETAKGEGRFVASCPKCQQSALLVGDGQLSCLVCGEFKLNPIDTAEAYARASDLHWKHPKHGVGDALVWCPECDQQAVVPVGDDLAEQVSASLAHIPREVGEDWEYYVCMSCGEPWTSRLLRNCGYCGTEYFSSDEDSICPVCGRF